MLEEDLFGWDNILFKNALKHFLLVCHLQLLQARHCLITVSCAVVVMCCNVLYLLWLHLKASQNCECLRSENVDGILHSWLYCFWFERSSFSSCCFPELLKFLVLTFKTKIVWAKIVSAYKNLLILKDLKGLYQTVEVLHAFRHQAKQYFNYKGALMKSRSSIISCNLSSSYWTFPDNLKEAVVEIFC